jgi:glycosyltransferase involved in cell wall biosynthesis
MKLAIHKRLAILGTVGIPANYGGFETLAENLVKCHHQASLNTSILVYCSSKSYPSKEPTYLSAQLKYISLNANGAQSIPYDIFSLLSAIWNRSDVILLLGVSGSIALPLVRLISSARIVTNIDGIEWRRDKWQGLAKIFLRFSEKMAVIFSHEVIADNAAIAEYLKQTYGVGCHVIAYGGDHVLSKEAISLDEYNLPEEYTFSVCRIEPENNVHMVLETFAQLPSKFLVMVGNWNNSDYGKGLRKKYSTFKNIVILDPIFDLGKLKSMRSKAALYIHGHSAGGTNPSLVEAMHFGKVILAFDCDYNRSTTENKALFFRSSEDLRQILQSIKYSEAAIVGRNMLEIARRRYTWEIVAEQYFSLLRV